MADDSLDSQRGIFPNVFENNLLDNEEILWHGKADTEVRYNKKAILRLVFVLLGLLFILISYIKLDPGRHILLPPLIISAIIFIIIWTSFLEKKLVRDVYYALTNYRIMKYDNKNGKFTTGDLNKFSEIEVTNLKENGYGDVLFRSMDDLNALFHITGKAIKKVANIKSKADNEEDILGFMAIQYVPNPNEVAAIAKKALEDMWNIK